MKGLYRSAIFTGKVTLMSFEILLQKIDTLTQGVVQRDVELKTLRLTIEKLKIELSYLKRMRYGRASEKMDKPDLQLELLNAALTPMAPSVESAVAPQDANVTDIEDFRKKRNAKTKRPTLRHLPEHLPREDVIHTDSPDCTCGECGAGLRQIGQDVSEVLEYEPGSFKVIRHIRPKFACVGCHTIAQAPAPSRPIERGLAGVGLLAHVLVGKYCDHLPLYRQSQIYAREGVEIDRSTMVDWVAGCAALLQPLADAVRKYVMSANKIHTDDTPVPVLSPGRGKTKTARLWVYARDDRPCGDTSPPAVWFEYSPNRKGENPLHHLAGFTGVLQADAYAGYDRLFADGQIVEAACWAHYLERCFMWSSGSTAPSFSSQHCDQLTPHNLRCYVDARRCVGERPCRSHCARSRVLRRTSPVVSGTMPACSRVLCIHRAAVRSPVTAVMHA